MSGNIKQAAAAARRASQLLATTPEAVRDEALAAIAAGLEAARERIETANAEDLQAAAQMVADELAGGDGALEVFRDEGRRRVVMLATQEVPTQGALLEGNPVIAITGGTRGITARVALELAGRGPCKLALLARTAPGTAPGTAAGGCLTRRACTPRLARWGAGGCARTTHCATSTRTSSRAGATSCAVRSACPGGTASGSCPTAGG